MIGGPMKHNRKRGWRHLALIVLAVSAIWLIVLPRLAHLPAVRERTAWLEEKGIDLTAFNYSDHPCAAEIEERLNR